MGSSQREKYRSELSSIDSKFMKMIQISLRAFQYAESTKLVSYPFSVILPIEFIECSKRSQSSSFQSLQCFVA